MKYPALILTCALLVSSGLGADTFSALLGHGPGRADQLYGKPQVQERDNSRSYNADGYALTLYYEGKRLRKVTIEGFPAAQPARTPEDIAKLIGPNVTVGQIDKRGILQHCFMTDPAIGSWEVFLTPGTHGFAVANLTPPDTAAARQPAPVVKPSSAFIEGYEAAKVGQTLDEVMKENGKPSIQDKDTGWAFWPHMRVKFTEGKAVEVVMTKP